MTTSDRRPYENAGDLNQDLLDEMADNLCGNIETVVEIQAPDGEIIRVSDRHKYVDGDFYPALIQNLPDITKTIGEWLVPGITFSSISLSISNVDGRFNKYLPAGGVDFKDWVGLPIIVRNGLKEIGSSYKNIFEGFVTEVAGFGRTTKTLEITARDRYDEMNRPFPTQVFSNTEYPFIEDSNLGLVKPLILGDYTINNTRTPAMIPSFCVNGADPNVDGQNDPVRNNVQYVISENANQNFQAANVFLKISDNNYVNVPSSEIVNINIDNNYFEVKQKSATWIPTEDQSNPLIQYEFSTGDEFVVRVQGLDIGGPGYDDNIIAQARYLLETYGGLGASDFDANWEYFRLKSAPIESAISTFQSRVWVQDQQGTLEYVLQMLEQVRLELFVERTDLNIKLNSLHFEEKNASPSHTIKNWDVERDSLSIATSDTVVFNVAQGDFDFNPSLDANNFKTPLFKNQASIDATKRIEKGVIFPNLVDRQVVSNQLKEILKLSSSAFEVLDLRVTWRSLLQDIGNNIKFDVKIGSTVFDNVITEIRDIGYGPSGVVTLRLWSYAMTPFPGYEPNYDGTVGGYNALIEED